MVHEIAFRHGKKVKFASGRPFQKETGDTFSKSVFSVSAASPRNSSLLSQYESRKPVHQASTPEMKTTKKRNFGLSSLLIALGFLHHEVPSPTKWTYTQTQKTAMMIKTNRTSPLFTRFCGQNGSFTRADLEKGSTWLDICVRHELIRMIRPLNLNRIFYTHDITCWL